MTDTERRYVCRLIDSAVERCEEGNLREQLEVPRWIADVVVHLQAAAGEDLRIPKTRSLRTAICSTYGSVT
jgi:hypothetical protein